MNIAFRLTTAALAGSLSLFSLAQGPTALRGGLVPNADVFIHANLSLMNASPFSKAVEANQPAELKKANEEKEAQFKAATGLDAEDLLALVISADINEVDFEAADATQMSSLPAIAAAQFAKAITLDQAVEGFKLMIADMDPEGAKFTKGDVAGQAGIIITATDPAAADDGPSAGYLLLAEDGKTALFGVNADAVAAGKLRVDNEERPTPSADLGKAIASLGKQQARIVVLIPEVIQAEIKEMLNAPVDPNAGMMNPAAMLKPLANLKGIYVGMTATDNMDFKLSMDVGDSGSAMALNGMAQGMLPMAAMMGLPPTLSQKINISHEDSVVSIKASLSPEDIQAATDGGAAGL